MSVADIIATREQRRQMIRDNAQRPAQLVEVTRDQWPEAMLQAKKPPLKVWRSRDFLVQLHPESGATRLSINRTVLDGDRWADGIDWDTLQRLKAEAGFALHWAVEVFPPVTDVVNVANMRHLFLLPEAPGYAWRRT